MARHPHLYRRQAVYWWHRRIPTHLRQLFAGPEIRVSTRAHMVQEAAARSARLRTVTDLAFQALERAVTTGTSLPDQAFDQLVNRLVRDELDRCERERELAGPRNEADVQQAVLHHQRRRAQLQQALRHNTFAELEPELAPAVASVQDIATEADLAALRRRAVRGLVEASHTNEAREHGVYGAEIATHAAVATGSMSLTPDLPGQTASRSQPNIERTAPVIPPGPMDPAAASASVGQNVVSLKQTRSSVSDGHSAQPGHAAPAATSKGFNGTPAGVRISDVKAAFINDQTKHMQRHFRVAIEFLEDGLEDAVISDLTREAVAEVIELVTQLPKYHGKGADNDLPLRELVARTNASEQDEIEAAQLRLEGQQRDRKSLERVTLEARIPRLSPQQSLINHRRRINRFLRWCHKKGHLPQPLQIDEEDIPRQIRDDAWNRDAHRGPRLSWGVDRLQKLLTSSIMRAPDKDFGDPMFWAILAGPHQGPRMEEFLQLSPDDVELQEGVPVFLIRQRLGQHTKTLAATRVVPLHPVLIEAGFLELVEQRRAEGSPWLFPMLDHGHDGRFTSVFTKRFSRYREDEGLYDQQRDYHSLRKDFNGRMKRAKVPQAARKALMGHKIEDLTDGVYDPEGDSIAQKLEYVKEIDFGIEIERVDGIPVVRLGLDAVS